MVRDDAQDVAADIYFICTEAKKFNIVAVAPSQAQLLAQIRAVQIQKFF